MIELINEKHLSEVTNEKNNKTRDAKTCDKTMLQFFYVKKNMFYHVKEKMKLFELGLWIKSMINYLNRKTDYAPPRPIYNKKRDIVYVDFGFAIGAELAYEHPCVVLSTLYDNLLVVPCSTGKLKLARDPQTGKLNKGYMIGTKAENFDRETALLLYCGRWISRDRVMMDTKKRVPDGFFAEIQQNFMRFSLGSQYQHLQSIKEENRKQVIDNASLRQRAKEMDAKIKLLEGELKSMQNGAIQGELQ